MDRYQQAALDFVNRLRVALGKPELTELPKGNEGSAMSCPLAVALGPGVGACHDFVDFYDAEAFNKLTEAGIDVRQIRSEATYRVRTDSWEVREFVSHFDNGEYPELIA